MGLLDESYFPKDTGALGNAALGVRSFLNLLGGRVASPNDLYQEDQTANAMQQARLNYLQQQGDAYKMNNLESQVKLQKAMQDMQRQQELQQGASDLYKQMNTPFVPSPKIAEPGMGGGLADMERTLGAKAPSFTPDWSPPSETEQYKRLGQYYAGQGDVNTADKIMDTLNKGREKVKDWKQTVGPNGQPVYTPLYESGNVGPSGPTAVQDLPEGFTYGPNGQMMPIDDYWRLKREQAAAGASRTSVNVNSPYEPQFQKELAGLDAKQLDKYRTQSDAARSMMATLDRLEKLSPKVYEAGGANAKVSAANFLKGMGIDVDPTKLANSQEFNALSSKLVMDSLGGTLGAGVSNADVAFLQATVPNIGQSKEARQQLVNFMRQKAKTQASQFDDAYGYAVKNKGLMGYNPNQRMPGEEVQTPADRPANLSAADRAESLKNARNAILRNPSQKDAIIQRLEQNGITNHGLK